MTQFPAHKDAVVVNHEYTETNNGPFLGPCAYLATQNGKRKTPLIWVSTGGLFFLCEESRMLRKYKYGVDPIKYIEASPAFLETASHFKGFIPLKDGWYLPGSQGTIPFSWRFPTPYSIPFTSAELQAAPVEDAQKFLDLAFTSENRRLFINTMARALSPGNDEDLKVVVVGGATHDAYFRLHCAVGRIMMERHVEYSSPTPRKLVADALKNPRMLCATIFVKSANADKFPVELDTRGRSCLMFAHKKKSGSRVKRFPRGWTVIEQTEMGYEEFCERCGEICFNTKTLALQLLKIVVRMMEARHTPS